MICHAHLGNGDYQVLTLQISRALSPSTGDLSAVTGSMVNPSATGLKSLFGKTLYPFKRYSTIDLRSTIYPNTQKFIQAICQTSRARPSVVQLVVHHRCCHKLVRTPMNYFDVSAIYPGCMSCKPI